MILCAWAGIRFLSGIDIFSRNVDYYAAYDQVSGMQEASPVVMRGVKIGTVTEIIFDSTDSEQVLLRLTVKKQFDIPKDSEARMASSGIMGGKMVEIVPGSSSEMLEKGDTMRSTQVPDMMEAIDPIMQQVTVLADELTVTLKALHEVVESNASNIEGMTSHMNSITGNIDQLLTSEKEGLKRAVKGISEFSTTLGNNAARLDSLMANMNSFSTKLAETQVVENLDKTLAELSTVLTEIREGDGTVGKLLSDEELYARLTQASENLSLLLADLKEHPSRYVHFSLFGQNEEKQQAKEAKRAAKEAKRAERDSLKGLR
jgi:phospholipid/cholesterol/gamma-HCH transport system substrate-binding protein